MLHNKKVNFTSLAHSVHPAAEPSVLEGAETHSSQWTTSSGLQAALCTPCHAKVCMMAHEGRKSWWWDTLSWHHSRNRQKHPEAPAASATLQPPALSPQPGGKGKKALLGREEAVQDSVCFCRSNKELLEPGY